MGKEYYFLDLFAGGGGLSEGFIQAGFKPIAHIESDRAACFTLRTRMVYHWLLINHQEEKYINYLNNTINREDLYNEVPEKTLNSVINAEINSETVSGLFHKVDNLLRSRRIDLIIGGPPCQSYSLVGRSRDKNKMQGDKRNHLYLDYAKFIKHYRPSYFVFENVTGLLSAKNEKGDSYLDDMQKVFKGCGYETEFKVLTAKDYGVLQSRKRVILIGKKGKQTGFYPEPEKSHSYAKVAEIFSGLPEITAGEGSPGPSETKEYKGEWLYEANIRNNDFPVPVTWHQSRPHNKRDLEIYRIAVKLWNKKKARLNYNSLPKRLKTHRQTASFVDRFKVVAADLPCSHTVVSHIAKDGHYYIHPDIKQNRSITPREAARLQTFPDNYYFEGASEKPSRTSAFQQIGNAVPVLMARKIAEKIREIW